MTSLEYIEEVSLMPSLLTVSAFCAASETAYSVADQNDLKAMCEENRFGAKLALNLSERFDHVLTSILIADTVVCIALSSVGAVVFGDLVEDDEYGAAISGAIITIMILIFGSISPKLLAKEAAEKLACILAYPLYIMTLLMTPLSYMLAIWKHCLMKVFKLRTENE